MRIRKKKIGLALGSGAARGFAHIGVIKVLEENELPISMVAGTSMGALIGALYAAGLSGKELEEIACNVDLKTIAKLFVPTPSLNGLISGNRITELLESLVGNVDMKSLKIPLAVVAVDIESAEEVVIKEGSLIEAVRASISIPGIFTTANYQNRFLVDGGLLNPIPVDVVRNMGANFVIAVNVPYPIKAKPVSIKIRSARKQDKPVRITNSKSFNKRLSKFVSRKANLKRIKSRYNELVKGVFEEKNFIKPNIFKTIMVTIRIMENQIKQLQLSQNSPDILIEPNIEVTSSFDFRKTREVIKLGEQEARRVLEKIL